ncbi:MAG: DUF2948 family protein [Pseudomonadota bacterium]
MDDARFEDGASPDAPLRLMVETDEDLKIASALIQDAIGTTGDISWMPRRRRMVMALNRFRWEDREAAERQRRPYERVRTTLVIDSVMSVRTRGLDPNDKELTFSVLGFTFAPGEDGAGQLLIPLAGDGDLALEVECLDLRMSDVSRPWVAKAGAPDHKLEDGA